MNTHRIHRVAKLTGLSKDVIRVWERRYGLLKPIRGTNRYRNYSDEDVALLRYIKSEMDKGASIGILAALGREHLLSRLRTQATPPVVGETSYERLVGELLATLEPLDRVTFERRLNGAVAVIPFEEALENILLPLQRRVGELWHDSRVSVAIEHYVTKQVQQKLFTAMNHLPINEDGPKVVVACPAGQFHEIGAQAVAYRCGVRGCRVYYLGPNVPTAALASLCVQVQPHLALLSLPLAMPETEMVQLAKELAEQVGLICRVMAGGPGALAAKHILENEKIEVLNDLGALTQRLLTLSADRSAMTRL